MARWNATGRRRTRLCILYISIPKKTTVNLPQKAQKAQKVTLRKRGIEVVQMDEISLNNCESRLILLIVVGFYPAHPVHPCEFPLCDIKVARGERIAI